MCDRTIGGARAAARKRAAAAPSARRRRRRQPGGGAQRVGLVGALPREVVVLAAEVAVGGGLLVDRAVQLEVLAEGARAQVEVLVDELGDLRAADLLGPERLDIHRHRVRDADRVGDLHLAAVGQAGGDHVLGHIARRVGGRAVDLARVLAAERAAAVARHAAVGVDDDLAAGQAGVADRAADHEPPRRVDQEVLAQLAGVVEILRAGSARRRAPRDRPGSATRRPRLCCVEISSFSISTGRPSR